MTSSLTSKTVNSSVWSIVDIALKQGIGFVISVILARLLTPSDYGTIGLIMIFITIFNVFVDSGFSIGLIRKNDRTEEDLNTAFYFNITVGIGVYLTIFLSSPLIAIFFDNAELCLYLRVLGLTIVISSFNLVQNAIMVYSMRIKQLALINAIAQISTGMVAIIMAFKGFGVWSLIMQHIVAVLFIAIFLFFSTKWRPRLQFSISSFKYLWNFGSKLLGANLMGTLFAHAYSFVIGKFLGQKNLGLYGRANNFAKQPSGIIVNIINKSIFPSLSKCQNDLVRLRENYIKCIEMISLIIFPLMFCLSLVAEPLFLVLFGLKWVEAIPIFRILCIGYAFDVFSTISLQLMNVMGRSDYTLKLEFIKKPIYGIVIVVSVFGGLKGIVVGEMFYCILAAAMNLSVVKFLLKYDYTKQVFDILKYAALAAIVLLTSWILLKMISNDNWCLLIIYPFVSIGIYIAVVKTLKLPAFELAHTMIKKKH